MGTVGHKIVAERLARFARDVDNPRVGAIARAAARPVTVAVRGRPGVGLRTVARALASAGVAVSRDGDVVVHVVAEVVKPEDRAAIDASTVVVQNKSDLSASLPRVVPMVAHLALAHVDESMLSALHALASEPQEFGSVDDVARGPYRLLLETLDVSGITHALRALRDGEDVRRALRHASGVDGVVAALVPRLAEAGYRRVRSAAAALEAVAAADQELRPRITDFLRQDDTVLAVMAAAVDVVEAAGMTVDPGDDRVAHLRRAAHWDRYRRECVDTVHQSCGGDIVRGSLRLWAARR